MKAQANGRRTVSLIKPFRPYQSQRSPPIVCRLIKAALPGMQVGRPRSASWMECFGSFLDQSDGFQMKDRGPLLVGHLKVEREVQRPVVEVVRIDEGLVDRQAVFGKMRVAGV